MSESEKGQMPVQSVVILDGSPLEDSSLDQILLILNRVLRQNGARVETIPLRSVKMAHCLGCFECWTRRPGLCVAADASRDIARAAINADTLVLFTPVTYGGYSPELKKFVDHMIQFALPTFETRYGELHHPARYERLPRFVVVGVQHEPNAAEAGIFRVLAGRNALNFSPPSYAVEIVNTYEDPSVTEERLLALRRRVDPFPARSSLSGLLPDPAASATRPRRALLIVGSPKVKRPSTSSVLGGYLIDRLCEQGIETESFILRPSLVREDGQRDLIAAFDRADLVLLAFPLYVDALPFLVTRALTVLATRSHASDAPAKRLMAICNSGFPEPHQSTVALAICRQFALATGMTWAGGLALGAGEAVSSGRPLDERRERTGPSVDHLIRALQITAVALAQGSPVPLEAVSLFAKTPVPLPFSWWRWLFATVGDRHMRREAAAHGVSRQQMLARPYLGAA